MTYWKSTLIEGAQPNSTGDVVPVHGFDKFVVAVETTGNIALAIEARLEAGSWRELARFSSDGELAVENFGWYELRARTLDGDEGATASAYVSGRPI